MAESAFRPSYHIPFLRNRRFVGRDTPLQALTQKLLVTRDCQKVALVGLGGVGKSQVALEFAYTVKATRSYLSIFWVSALSAESFEQACIEIARNLRISQAIGDREDVKELVRRHLSTDRAGQWLMIVDNADDMDVMYGSDREESVGVADYLPESEDGLIVFTTRSQEAAVALASGDVIELVEMSREEAVTFLEKSLIRKDLLYNEAIATELLKELTYLPLAIAQAAAYLNTNKIISVAEYLGLLRNTEQDMISIMSHEFRDSTRYKGSKNAVATTWLVSFDQIRKYDPIAADLLSFMSYIEMKAIPRSILPAVQPEARMMSAMGILSGYAFVVRRGDEEMYDLHRLVHLATRVWIRKNGHATETAVRAVLHVAATFPANEYDNRDLWREYLPHALKVLESNDGEELAVRYDLCMKVGMCLQEDGRVGEAVRWLEETVRWREEKLDDEHPSRLASQHVLAGAYQADGQVGKAVELLEHVVTVEAKVLGEEHLDRLASQHALAIAYQADGQVGKAVELLEHVVAVRAKVLMEEHPDRLASQHALAGAYQADGQVGKAVKLLEHVVAIKAKVLREEHPSRLASQHALAIVYEANEQVGKAIELLKHVVTMQAKVLVKEHPDRLASQHALAIAYETDGQVRKAVKLLQYVVAVRAKVLMKEHPDRLASQHALAGAYQTNEQVGKAVELLEHVVAVQAKVLVEEHPDRLASQHALAIAYQADGQVGKAVELLKHVVAVQARVLVEEHPDRLASQHALAGAYQADKQVGKAVELLEHVVAVNEKVLKEDHPTRLISQRALAICHAELEFVP